MAEDIVGKTLEVLIIANATELATGDLIHQVILGEYINNTPEVLSRIPTNMRESYTAKKIGVGEITLFIKKKEEIPYKVGSKWRLKIHKNGTLNLVEAK